MGMPSEIAAALEARGHRWREARALAGDVGRRRYFRLYGVKLRASLRTSRRTSHQTSHVLALYPEDLQDVCRRFGVTTGWLAGAGVQCPTIVDADCEAGWMLLEDLGPETLYDRFRDDPDPWSRLMPWYRAAVEIATRIAALPTEPVATLNPPLDATALRRELDKTWSVFFEPAGLTRHHGLGRRLDEVLTGLCGELERGPDHGRLVPCHRDFMVRNLVPAGSSGDSLGVLDHQDLRLGPRFYDLASLLNDSLFPPAGLEDEVLRERAPTSSDRLAYRRAAVQRTLKAVGTFAGSGTHGSLIRPTLARALRHLATLPEGAAFAEELVAWEKRAFDDLLD